MFRLLRVCSRSALVRSNCGVVQQRQLVFSANLAAKKLEEVADDKNNTVHIRVIDAPDEENLLQVDDNGEEACALCKLGVEVKYDDVLILEQFMRQDGTVLPRNISGICAKQQQIVERCVMQAHWAGLFPDRHPAGYLPNTGTYKQLKRRWDSHKDLYKRNQRVQDGVWFYIKRY